MCSELGLHIDHNHQRHFHISNHIKYLGLKLKRISDLQSAQEAVRTNRYRLVLIHSDTIGKQIFNFCELIRSGSNLTILIVLMNTVDTDVEEKLFESGVDDVVVGKQASAGVLAKRIQARLCNRKIPDLKTNAVRLKNTIVDFDRREVWCNGTIRRLPGILADLLKYFLDNPERIISRQELANSPIWVDSICSSAEEGGKTFDVNVGKLRKIIEFDPINPQIIISVRGVGWKLAKDIGG